MVFKGHLLHKIGVLLLCLVFTDLLISTIRMGHSFSIRRILRPFFLMLFIRDLRRQYRFVGTVIGILNPLPGLYLSSLRYVLHCQHI